MVQYKLVTPYLILSRELALVDPGQAVCELFPHGFPHLPIRELCCVSSTQATDRLTCQQWDVLAASNKDDVVIETEDFNVWI